MTNFTQKLKNESIEKDHARIEKIKKALVSDKYYLQVFLNTLLLREIELTVHKVLFSVQYLMKAAVSNRKLKKCFENGLNTFIYFKFYHFIRRF